MSRKLIIPSVTHHRQNPLQSNAILLKEFQHGKGLMWRATAQPPIAATHHAMISVKCVQSGKYARIQRPIALRRLQNQCGRTAYRSTMSPTSWRTFQRNKTAWLKFRKTSPPPRLPSHPKFSSRRYFRYTQLTSTVYSLTQSTTLLVTVSVCRDRNL
jgi:hypothetical protein